MEAKILLFSNIVRKNMVTEKAILKRKTVDIKALVFPA
jgi:hypothetical protein